MTKRKYGFLVLCLIFLSTSCQNNDKAKPHSAQLDSKEALKSLIKQYPDSLMLVQNLIETYRNEGSYDSAIVLTDTEIRKDSGNAYLWNMKATLSFENLDTLNAIKAMEHAVNLYPLPEYLIALGTIYAEVKNKNALLIADELLKANKTKYGKDAFFLKGLFYNYEGNSQKAISLFDSSLKLDFTYMYAYREKAIALYDIGKFESALNTLKRAVTIQNNFDEGYYWMGKCYEKLHRKEEAIQSYQNALLYDKNFIEARDALEKLKIDN